MSAKQTCNRPSTPPASLPTSPTTPRSVALRTPLKIPRARHSSFVPVTPQSLKPSRSPLIPKNKYGSVSTLTPSHKLSSAQVSNWRIYEDGSPNETSSQEFVTPDTRSPVEPVTPTKHLGPFTPQVAKQVRDPLRLDAIAEDFQARGSLTDPPPRRRMGRSILPDENHSELAMIKPLDINVPVPECETRIMERSSLPTEYSGSQNNTPDVSIPHYTRISHHHTPPAPNFLEDSPVIPTISESEVAVLRIDNDVTPFMLETWLGNPFIHCHVLLDRLDGRTLSHAYLETTPDIARAALRSHQNKILGQGRRSRPVTLTLSGQEELMHDIFPSWIGRFKGTTSIYEASLIAPPSEILTSSELSIMLHLIQSPKSHFLKVPCLAYWSLLSTLVKFPTPDVFAPGLAPDALFDITTYALEKYETLVGSREYDCVLHTKLIAGAIHCRAFTDRQLHALLRFTNRPLPVIQRNLGPNPNSPVVTQSFRRQSQPSFSPNQIQHSWDNGAAWLPTDPRSYPTMDPCDRVAQDFGVDPSLVHALAERLTLHKSTTGAPLGRI
ncbi:hypothetical protein FRC09_008552 [Ceratobasidium sp. 395]|nr:hypothetical protein FRC09_008552 [Ceratobasidium sp. 395]